MKAWYGSDLHVEYPGNKDLAVLAEGADVAILAGDIGEGVAGIEWAAETFDIPVIYVSGNHEYYQTELQQHTGAMRERARELGVHFLEQDAQLQFGQAVAARARPGGKKSLKQEPVGRQPRDTERSNGRTRPGDGDDTKTARLHFSHQAIAGI